MLNSNEVLYGNFPRSRGFGTQPNGFFHNGIDLRAPYNTGVKSRFAGIVRVVGTNPPGQDFGNYIRIFHPQLNISSWYAHLKSQGCKVGQQVSQGQLIGQSGNTGLVDPASPYNGSHLHYSESKAESLTWINPDTTQGGEDMISDSDNEYGRWGKLGQQIRGRQLSRDEFRKAAVGRTWLAAMETLSDDAEADRALDAQRLGQTAIADNWEGQIGALKQQVDDLSKQIEDLKKQLQEATAHPPAVDDMSVGDLLRLVIKKVLGGGK